MTTKDAENGVALMEDMDNNVVTDDQDIESNNDDNNGKSPPHLQMRSPPLDSGV